MTSSRKIKKKIFILGLLMPILFYAFTGVRLRRIAAKQNSNSDRTRKWMPHSNHTTPRKIVILYSNQRSGSTFMGEIFNQNKDVFYLYEPLFPYTPRCDVLKQERLDVLEKMLKCNFSGTKEYFENAKIVTRFQDMARCIRNSVCFYHRSEAIKNKYSEYCQESFVDKERASCGLPLHPHIVSEVCLDHSIVAFKVLRICSLKEINDLRERFKKDGKDVFVVHLVRDPRAIISSKLRLELKAPDALYRATELCNKMEKNLEYIDELKDPPEVVKDDRYMRIRYEEAATNPILTAKKVYSFLGLELPKEVENWLTMSTILPSKKLEEIRLNMNNPALDKHMVMKKYVLLEKQMRNPYGTIRDPSTIVQKWRTKLPIETVKNIQQTCTRVLEHLRYKFVDNRIELTNLTQKLF